MKKAAGCVVDIRTDEEVRLQAGSEDTFVVVITLEHKSGQAARLRINAPAAVRITRNEKTPAHTP